MNKVKLEKELDEALNTLNKEANDTLSRYSSNEQLREALSFVYKDIFDCLKEYKNSIIKSIE